MESEGINVSEMNALLLKKVEELALYIIQQNEELQKQNEELQKQNNEIQMLKTKYTINVKMNVLKIATLLLILTIILCDCKKVEFTEFQSCEFGCNWINLKQDEVIVINSSTEFEKYTDCPSYVEQPEVDFSKYTLLIAGGQTNRGVYEIAGQLKRFSKNNYTLHLTIDLSVAQIMENWTYSILVPKMSSKAQVRLNAKYIH
ncbi:MAG: hypothetical protein LBR55_05505 [Bacteroidales bacterium]|jgi:hypothetical protein|nr:hypothetical protein [Bacteroidales bacterium]